MLTNASNNGPKCLLQLPINTIIKHIEQDNSLISDTNITISLKLNKKLFNPVKTIAIVSNLGNEQCSLDLFKVLHLLLGISLSELVGILMVHLLVEWKLLDVHDHL